MSIITGAPGSTYPAFLLHSWSGPNTDVDGDARLLVADANYSRYWYDRRPMKFTDAANPPSLDWQPLPVENAAQLTVSANLHGILDSWTRKIGASLVYPDDLTGGPDVTASEVRLAQSSATTVTMGVPNIVGATVDAFASYENPDRGKDMSFFEFTNARREGLPLTTANVQLTVVRPPYIIHPARAERISATTDWSWQTSRDLQFIGWIAHRARIGCSFRHSTPSRNWTTCSRSRTPSTDFRFGTGSRIRPRTIRSRSTRDVVTATRRA